MLEQYDSKNDEMDSIKIKVIGVGGGGNNAVTQMINSNVYGAEYYLVNTEIGTLNRADKKLCKTLQIGKETTRGLGAGAKPEIGEKAARESIEEIDKMLEGADLVFLTAGMGGGTGTGALPVIAEEARKKGILTVAVVTTPFAREGKLREARAQMGIDRLKQNVNSLIVISNQKLIGLGQKLSVIDLFKKVDDILRQAIESIIDIIYSVGTINVDFADVKTVLSYEGYAYMGLGTGEGDNKVENATKDALDNPLIERKIDGAKGVIINIRGGEAVTLDDADKALEIIKSRAKDDANIIMGTEIDERYGKDVLVTVIATAVDDIDKNNKNKSTTIEDF